MQPSYTPFPELEHLLTNLHTFGPRAVPIMVRPCASEENKKLAMLFARMVGPLCRAEQGLACRSCTTRCRCADSRINRPPPDFLMSMGPFCQRAHPVSQLWHSSLRSCRFRPRALVSLLGRGTGASFRPYVHAAPARFEARTLSLGGMVSPKSSTTRLALGPTIAVLCLGARVPEILRNRCLSVTGLSRCEIGAEPTPK